MRFVFAAVLLAASTLAAQAEPAAPAREPEAQERAAVEEVLRANLPEELFFLGADFTLSAAAPDIDRACGHVWIEGGTKIPFAVALARTQGGEAIGKSISMEVDGVGPEAAVAACAEVGVTLTLR